MLNLIANMVSAAVLPTEWSGEMDAWGRRVKLYRDYERGVHRAKMTKEMQEMLSISDPATDQFNVNYCELVVQTMADRLKLAGLHNSAEEATAWGEAALAASRFDALQMDVHVAALRDGDAFVMVGWDNEAQIPILTYEPAWDGTAGMLPIYDAGSGMQKLVAAVKIFSVGGVKRVNVYWPAMVEKYTLGEKGDTLTLTERTAWTLPDGEALGVPVVHFRNKASAMQTVGRSEIAQVVTMQDGLNATFASMISTAMLTGFPIHIAVGFKFPQALAPGVVVSLEDVVPANMRMDTLKHGELGPFIDQAGFIIEQIATVTRTPLLGRMGSDAASGESLKQREVGLLGKVKAAHVKFGNTWEDVMALAWQVADAYAFQRPPTAGRWTARWESAQLRNDSETIRNALLMREVVSDREVLRLTAATLDYDEARITLIETERAEEANARVLEMAGNLPGLGE